MDVLCAGLVGVSGKVGDVEAQGGVVAQDSVQVAEEGPGEGRALQCGALCDDCAVADGAAGFMQGGTEYGKEDDRCNETLEGKEVLNLDGVSQVYEQKGACLRNHTLV